MSCRGPCIFEQLLGKVTELLNPSSIIWTSEFANRHDSKQHAQLHRLNRMLKFMQNSSEQTTKILIILHRHAGWSVLLRLNNKIIFSGEYAHVKVGFDF